MAEPNDFSKEAADRSSLVQMALHDLGLNDKSLAMNWLAQAQLYSNWWYWWDSKPMTEMIGPKKDRLKFPLGINPIKWITMKHASALFGEVSEDNSDSMVGFRFRNVDGKKDELTKKAEEIIGQIWSDSHGAEIQSENALISQVAGGCVFKINYWPSPLYQYGIRVTAPMPDFFYPVWDSEDKWMLHEAILGYYITPEEALLKYGVKPSDQKTRVVYVERWTKDFFEIKVDGVVPTNVSNAGVPVKFSGPNPYGFVPFVYIPHRFRGGMFYGTSHVPSMTGMVEELNSRLADRGDMVKRNAESVYTLVNSRQQLQTRVVEGIRFLDIGKSMPDGKSEPNAALLETNSTNASVGKEFTSDLWRMLQHDSDTPSVSWGEDEGSQRSSATLEVRFWPLLVHMRGERTHWTEGMKILNKMALSILASKGLVDKKVLTLRGGVDWAEILPRERSDKVAEIVQRRASDIMSRRNALMQLSRGEDIEEEEALIVAEKEEESQRVIKQAEATKPPTPAGSDSNQLKPQN